MEKVILSEDEKYLIDSRGIKFKKPIPLSTIEVRVSTAHLFNARIDNKKDFVDAIKIFLMQMHI